MKRLSVQPHIVVFCPPCVCTWQGAASVIQTDALGESQEIAHLDTGHYFGEVRQALTPIDLETL